MPSNLLLAGAGLIPAAAASVYFIIGMWPLVFNDAPPGEEELDEAVVSMLMGCLRLRLGRGWFVTAPARCRNSVRTPSRCSERSWACTAPGRHLRDHHAPEPQGEGGVRRSARRAADEADDEDEDEDDDDEENEMMMTMMTMEGAGLNRQESGQETRPWIAEECHGWR